METLGDMITLLLVVAALIVVPYKLARVWVFPHARQLLALFIMSRNEEKEGAPEVIPERYMVPVPSTDTSASTNESVPPKETTEETEEAWELPRVSRYLDDKSIVVMLATQKKGGKYRFGANEIYNLVKGSRGDVLAIIRQVREAPADYPERTPEQQQTREELALGKV